MNRIIIAIFIVCVASCSGEDASGLAFFGNASFSKTRADSKVIAKRLAGDLIAMGEPSIASTASNTNAHMYRFTWQRSLSNPITISLTFHGTDATLAVKELDAVRPDGGRRIEGLRRSDIQQLSYTQIHDFFRRLLASHFWSLPTADPKGPAGLDGSTWLFEGVRNGHYHATVRWSPLPPYGRGLGPKNEHYGLYRNVNDPERTELALPDELAQYADLMPMDPSEFSVSDGTETKTSREAGLDVLSLYLMMLGQLSDENIY